MYRSKGFAMGPPPSTPGRAVFAARNQGDSPGPIYAVPSTVRSSSPGGRFSPVPRFESPRRFFGTKVARAANYGTHSPGPIYDPPSDFTPKPTKRVPPTRVPDRFQNGYVTQSASPGPIYDPPTFGKGLACISFGAGPRFPPHNLFQSRKLSKRANYGVHSPGPIYEPYSDFGPMPPLPPRSPMLDTVAAQSPGPADARPVPRRNWCTSPSKLQARVMKRKGMRPGTAPAATMAHAASSRGSLSTHPQHLQHPQRQRRQPQQRQQLRRLPTSASASAASLRQPVSSLHSPIRGLQSTSSSRSSLFPYVNAEDAGPLPASARARPKSTGNKAAFTRVARGRARTPLGTRRAAKPKRAPGALPVGYLEGRS